MNKIPKKIISLLVMTAILSSMAGCQQMGRQDARQDSSSANYQQTDGQESGQDSSSTAGNPLSSASQLKHMIKKMIKHTRDGHTYFAVTDLDQNGRLELLCSTDCQGSGRFTYSHFYQIDSAGTRLEKCQTPWNQSSEPDIVNGINKVYHNPKTGEYHYITQDFASAGGAADNITVIEALTLKDNDITTSSLGYREGIWKKKKQKHAYRYYRTTKKGRDKKILSDNFNEDYLSALRFHKCEKASVNIEWFEITERSKNLTEETVQSYLEKSWDGFRLGYFLKQTEWDANIKHLKCSDTTMTIPQLVNMPDKEKQDRLNKIIQEELRNFFKWTDEDTDLLEDGWTYSLYDWNCTVKYAGTDRLSLLIQCEGYGKGAAHPNFLVHVLNLDLEKEKLIPKKNILSPKDRKKIGRLILSGICRDITHGSMYRETQKKLHHINPLKKAADWDVCQIYFTEDSIGIAIPTFHAIGDYSVYEVLQVHIE